MHENDLIEQNNKKIQNFLKKLLTNKVYAYIIHI